MDELQQLLSKINMSADEPLAFLSHHKGGAKVEARTMKDRLCELLKLPKDNSKVFLDSDETGWTLNELLDRVRKSHVLVLIQTERTLYRPFVIGEVVAALEAGIPIVPVIIRGGGYDFAKTARFLSARDFRSAMEKDTPGCVEVLEKQGIDVGKAGELLKEAIPQFASIELDLALSCCKPFDCPTVTEKRNSASS